MRRKSSKGEGSIQLPEDKLKFLSYIDDLQSTRALHPVTPQRNNKQWIMDAWEDHSQCDTSPDKNKYINKMIENYEGKSFRLKKVQFFSEKVIHQEKISTPIREKECATEAPRDKQNKSRQIGLYKGRNRLYSIKKSSRKNFAGCEETMGPFKIPLSSVIYPMVRQPQPERQTVGKVRRRMERFHSFVARSIRR